METTYEMDLYVQSARASYKRQVALMRQDIGGAIQRYRVKNWIEDNVATSSEFDCVGQFLDYEPARKWAVNIYWDEADRQWELRKEVIERIEREHHND